MAFQDHDRRTRQSHLDDYSPSTSGAATPITSGAAPSSYLHSSVSGLVSGFGGLVRRFSDMTSAQHAQQKEGATSYGSHLGWPNYMDNNGINGVYTPPIHRSASPMGPPPLEPLQLKGFRDDTRESSRLLTPAVAEEIRIMIPERQRIDDEWNLVYSLDQDGASLGTLYEACSDYVGERASFVLVVRDNDGGLFGAYLSEAPHPRAHYFGNGECFLWRASIITSLAAALPPPPSEDTTHLARITTISSPTHSAFPRPQCPPPPPAPKPEEDLLIDFSDIPDPPPADDFSDIPDPPEAPGFSFSTSNSTLSPSQFNPVPPAPPRTASPAISIGPSIRFKAFPYSGENDFYMYCEPHCLSVGGGDGHYGLWLNDSLEKGVSSRCLTFGNEPLSDEGEKFGILGVEMWKIGRSGPR
ncbi:oxidation resistance protein 1 [Gnomoniopsis sp. IMI 355080]|nr:oxidation resistance protein 1 [Gnomoniopsis sp. IMI 355080]